MNDNIDFIVVGSGVAGLRAAVALASVGRVAVLTKDQLTESNTEYAQGGIAVVLSDDDKIELHVQDTLTQPRQAEAIVHGTRSRPSPVWKPLGD